MNLSRYLETLDPSKDHPGSRTDAFNRLLASCGIRTKSIPELGIAASEFGDLVEHEQGRHLAVELIARAYRGAALDKNQRSIITSFEGLPGSMINQFAYAGPRDYLLEPAIPLSEVVGVTTGIRNNYYKPFWLEDVQNATSRVGEGAEIPAVKITTAEKTITLAKYGRRLDVTYEALRRIPIDILSFYIRRIAVTVESEKVDKVLSTIISGDGNSGTAATSYNLTALDSGTTAGNLTLKAYLAFKMKFRNPRMLTTVLAQDVSLLKLMLLNTGSANIPLVMMGGLAAAQTVTPINQGLSDGVRGGWLDGAPANKIVGFDKRFSIERIFEIGGMIQEEDKDVKQQINSLVLSEVEGYAVLDPLANKIIDLSA